MPLPNTLSGLANAGYVHGGTERCAACGVKLEWFLTPKNHWIPMSLVRRVIVGEDVIQDVTSETQYEAHFASCPKAERFRRKR